MVYMVHVPVKLYIDRSTCLLVCYLKEDFLDDPPPSKKKDQTKNK